MVGVQVPIIPYAHEYLVTEAFDRRWSRCRRCATPTTSSTTAPRSAAW